MQTAYVGYLFGVADNGKYRKANILFKDLFSHNFDAFVENIHMYRFLLDIYIYR